MVVCAIFAMFFCIYIDLHVYAKNIFIYVCIYTDVYIYIYIDIYVYIYHFFSCDPLTRGRDPLMKRPP